MKANQAQHIARFRRVNPRIDYYPTAHAHAAICAMLHMHPKNNMREVLDMLVVEGLKTFRKD